MSLHAAALRALAAALAVTVAACSQAEDRAQAAPASAPQPASQAAPAPQPAAPAASMPAVQRFHHACDGGERIEADYVNTAEGISFVVLHWHGKAYGLAQALSASGARYVGMLGATPGKGLEWWGKGDNAVLSEVDGNDVDDSRVLMECKVVPKP